MAEEGPVANEEEAVAELAAAAAAGAAMLANEPPAGAEDGGEEGGAAEAAAEGESEAPAQGEQEDAGDAGPDAAADGKADGEEPRGELEEVEGGEAHSGPGIDSAAGEDGPAPRALPSAEVVFVVQPEGYRTVERCELGASMEAVAAMLQQRLSIPAASLLLSLPSGAALRPEETLEAVWARAVRASASARDPCNPPGPARRGA